MSRLPARRTVAATALVAPLLAGTLTGCGDGDGSAASQSPPKLTSSASSATPSSTASPTTSTSPTPSATGATTTPADWRAAAFYYVGDGPRGPVLFREFTRVPPSAEPLDLAVQGLQLAPNDPDYRSEWPAGSLVSAAVTGDTVTVTVGASATSTRPTAMSRAEARAAIQQVVYTTQAAIQRRLPVQFVRGATAADAVFGVPTQRPIPQGRVLRTLSLVNISTPFEGQREPRGTLVVDGVNNAFEGTVVVRLMQGDTVVAHQAGIGGFGGNQLYPWKVRLRTSKLAPGDYTIVATDGDASGNGRIDTDTKSITLE